MFYFTYFWYVIKHKANVAICAIKRGRWGVIIPHDMSKFSKAEFGPYARWFYGPYGVKIKNKLVFSTPTIVRKHKKVKAEFDAALEHHYKKNSHHWNHWAHKASTGPFIYGLDMPYKYLEEMVIDWEAMARGFGNPPGEFYKNNKGTILLSEKSRETVESLLSIE